MWLFACRLDACNIFEFLVKWQKNRGLDPNSCPEHSQYITDLCRQFSETLMEQLSQVASRVEQEMMHPVEQEVLLHAQHCNELVRQSLVSVMTQLESVLLQESSPCKVKVVLVETIFLCFQQSTSDILLALTYLLPLPCICGARNYLLYLDLLLQKVSVKDTICCKNSF